MSPAAPPPAHTRAGGGWSESAHVFGDGLVGVLARPASPVPPRAALVLFNAGLVHRVGPFRSHVELARRLAGEGFAVLRFDQSGLGDSALAPAALADARRAELLAALALVQSESGAERFVIGGICSGADDAFALADADPRIAGVLAIDGLGYRTPGYWLRHVAARLRPRKLWGVLQHLRGSAGRGVLRTFPPRAESARRLAMLVNRGVQLLFVYTGGAYRYCNHRGQLAAALGTPARARAVVATYWGDCDHTFYLRHDRERLAAAVSGWMHARFAATPAVAPSDRDVALAAPEGISAA